MGPEALEERFSPSELRRLQAEAEGLRERLVSAALRGRKRLRRRVTVGRTPLGECLRQLAETQGQWEAVVKEERALRGEEGQVTLLNLLEKGLALIDRIQALRERPRKRRKRKKRTEAPPGPAPQEEAPSHQKKSGKGGDQSPEGRAARDGPGPRHSKGEDQEEGEGSRSRQDALETEEEEGEQQPPLQEGSHWNKGDDDHEDNSAGEDDESDDRTGDDIHNEENDVESDSDGDGSARRDVLWTEKEEGGQQSPLREGSHWNKGGDDPEDNISHEDESDDGTGDDNHNEENEVESDSDGDGSARCDVFRTEKEEGEQRPLLWEGSHCNKGVDGREYTSGGDESDEDSSLETGDDDRSEVGDDDRDEGKESSARSDALGAEREKGQQQGHSLPMAPEKIHPKGKGRAWQLLRSQVETGDPQPGGEGENVDHGEGGQDTDKDDDGCNVGKDNARWEALRAEVNKGEKHTHHPSQEEGRREWAGDQPHGRGGKEPSPERGEGSENRVARNGPGTRHSRGEDWEEDPGEEEGDHERGSEGGESHESDGDSSGNTEDEGHDGEEDQDYVFSEDSDEEEDKGARCDSLWMKINNLEQKIFSLQDPSQEKVNDLVNEGEHLRIGYCYLSRAMKEVLMHPVMDLVSAVLLTSLNAVTALQEALGQFAAVEAAVLEAESDSLEGFLQAAQSKDTLEKLSNIYCSLNALRDHPLLRMDVPLKKVDAIKEEVDSWCSALLGFLLKEGQEKTNALQEKVDAMQGISPEQAGALKLKMDALQKKIGALKEMTALLAMTYNLHCKLLLGCVLEDNTFWKTRDLALTLMVHLKAVPQEEGLLWGKVEDFEAILHDIPVEKLMLVEEEMNACIRKLSVLQNKSLEEELKFLKEKLHSLGDSSHRELDELQEELDELQKDLDYLQIRPYLPFHSVIRTAVQRKVNILHEKMNALHKVDTPLVVNDEERNAGVWHTEVTQKERCVLVQNFAKTISPDNDSEAAKKILEAYARQIEEEVYSLANSKTEYHQLMAKKLNAMNKKLDETLRSPSPIHGIRRNEQPTLQDPCIQPLGVPSVAATTGEVQPPQLPRGTSTSTGSIQMLYTLQTNNRDSGCLIQPAQMSNVGSVSMQGDVPGAPVTHSLNALRPQNSQLSRSPIHQLSIPYSEFSAFTVVGIPPAQAQIPLGVAPFLPAPVSSPGFQPDTLQGQSTPLGQASSGSTSSNPNAAFVSRIALTSANPPDLSTTHPGSSGAWPLGCAPHSAAQKRPPSEFQAADDPRKALQIQETTILNRPQRLDPPQPEGPTCAESSGESLAGCEPAPTEGEDSEPPQKKQRMNPAGGTREPSWTQELFAVLQKHVSLAINQNMEKVSDMVSRLHGTALKDTEEAKALIAALEKALALLRFLFEYA